MVRYHIHDGDERIKTAERLAQSYVPEDDIQSFTSNEYHVVAVDGQQLIIDLRRNTYDVKADSDVIGKYNSWGEARAKFERLLEQSEAPK